MATQWGFQDKIHPEVFCNCLLLCHHPDIPWMVSHPGHGKGTDQLLKTKELPIRLLKNHPFIMWNYVLEFSSNSIKYLAVAKNAFLSDSIWYKLFSFCKLVKCKNSQSHEYLFPELYKSLLSLNKWHTKSIWYLEISQNTYFSLLIQVFHSAYMLWNTHTFTSPAMGRVDPPGIATSINTMPKSFLDLCERLWAMCWFQCPHAITKGWGEGSKC